MGTFGWASNPVLLDLLDLGITEGEAAGAVGYPTSDHVLAVWDLGTGQRLPDVLVPGSAKGAVPEFTCTRVVTLDDGSTAEVSVDAIKVAVVHGVDPPDINTAALVLSREAQLAAPAALEAAVAAVERADAAYALATANGPGRKGDPGPPGIGGIVQSATGGYNELLSLPVKLYVGATPPPAQPAEDRNVRLAVWWKRAVTSAAS